MNGIEELGRFLKLMTLTAAYYRYEVTDAVLALYYDDLREFSLEQVKWALSEHRKVPDQGRFFPKVADLMMLLKGDLDTRALQAYRVLCVSLAEIGVYQSVMFEDQALHGAVEALGGWVEVSRRWGKLDEEPFLKVDFVRLYKGLTRTAATVGGYFPGLHELQNQEMFAKTPINFYIIGKSGERQQAKSLTGG